jgi:hypothetical protein
LGDKGIDYTKLITITTTIATIPITMTITNNITVTTVGGQGNRLQQAYRQIRVSAQ